MRIAILNTRNRRLHITSCVLITLFIPSSFVVIVVVSIKLKDNDRLWRRYRQLIASAFWQSYNLYRSTTR